MKVEVLISTMHQNSYDLLDKMKINSDAVVVNQCDINSKEIIKRNGFNIIWINTTDRGLSNSRNVAICNAQGDLCILADDDEEFRRGYVDIVKCAFRNNPKYSILQFKIKGIEGNFKNYSKVSRKISYIKSMKVSSVELAFRRQDIVGNSIEFDSLIGAGTKYPMGEENSFLFQCLRKRLKIKYIPKVLANLHIGNSSWFTGYNMNYFIGRGAAFASMSKIFSFLGIIQFAVRKWKLYRNKISIIDAVKYMIQGRTKYINEKKIKNARKGIKIFLLGDFESTTGPAVANRALKLSLDLCSKVTYSKQQNKILRIAEIIGKTICSDNIILCGFSKSNFISLRIAKIFNKSVYYYMHGCHKIEDKINNIVNVTQNIEQEERLLKNVKKIICVSNFQKLKISEVYPEFKNKIIVHHNCMELSKFKYEIRRDEEYVVLSTGGGMPRKANLYVCEAIEKLIHEKEAKIKYIIIGPYCGQKEKFRKYSFLTYYEQLPHEKVLEEMKKANVYIQNSKFETFGLAIIEAILQGTSILVSKDTGALEVFNCLEDMDVIQNSYDVKEISEKLWKCLQNGNAKRLYDSIQFEEIDVTRTGVKLLEKLSILD